MGGSQHTPWVWCGALFSVSTWCYIDFIATMTAEPLQSDHPLPEHHIAYYLSLLAFFGSVVAPPASLRRHGVGLKNFIFSAYWLTHFVAVGLSAYYGFNLFAVDQTTRVYVGGGVTMVLQPLVMMMASLVSLGSTGNYGGSDDNDLILE
eukprot:PhF_6_TR19279/c0_g1_i1/m.28344